MMKHKPGLQQRITFFFVLFGALLTSIICLGVNWAVQDLEEQLLEKSLKFELEYFLSHRDISTGMVEQIGPDSTLYYINETQNELVPEEIRALPEGIHEVDQGPQLTYQVLVTRDHSGTFYLLKNTTPFEQREDSIQLGLISVFVASILTALWLGRRLSGKVIHPVMILTKQLEQLMPAKLITTQVTPRYSEDEVGQLATAFDGYLHKMDEFIRREQAFTADASHELRTPLTVIKGATELLLENPELPPLAHKQAERIDRAVTRMSQILEVLLLLARETAVSDASKQEPCQAGDIVTEIVAQHRLMIKDKPVTVDTRIISDFKLDTSRTSLNIVLCNLLRNAINHTEEGEVLVKVDGRQIQVCDTGTGINQVDLKNIFERNFRGNNAINTGSGIGLSIVKRICDRQKWDIDIQSSPDQGSTVTVTFF